MSSMKIVLRKKKNNEGKFPLTLRITKDRKTSFVYLGHYIKQDQWDAKEQRVRKNHPNATRLNNFLLKKLADATDKSIELETHSSEHSSYAVKQKIKPNGGTTFFDQADLYLETLKQGGKYNQ